MSTWRTGCVWSVGGLLVCVGGFGSGCGGGGDISCIVRVHASCEKV